MCNTCFRMEVQTTTLCGAQCAAGRPGLEVIQFKMLISIKNIKKFSFLQAQISL